MEDPPDTKHDFLFRVINCKRHEKRLQTFSYKAKKAGMHTEAGSSCSEAYRVCVHIQLCTDANKLTDKVVCKLEKQGIVRRKSKTFGDALSRVEIACGLSHVACWKALLKSNKTYMCVFEDDCEVYSKFLPLLDATLHDLHKQLPMPFHILHLVNGNYRYTGRRLQRASSKNAPVAIYREMEYPDRWYNTGTGCYVIHRDLAAAFLRSKKHSVFPLDDPIDVKMAMTDVVRFRHLVVKENVRTLRNVRFHVSPFCRVPDPVSDGPQSTQNDEDLVSSIRCARRIQLKRAKKA